MFDPISLGLQAVTSPQQRLAAANQFGNKLASNQMAQQYAQPTYWQTWDSPQPYNFGWDAAMQGWNTMSNLPSAIGNQFAFANMLNSANLNNYNQVAGPIDQTRIQSEANQKIAETNANALLQLQREKNQAVTPLITALLGGLGGMFGGGMTGFADTQSRQMAQLPTGSGAQPVNIRR